MKRVSLLFALVTCIIMSNAYAENIYQIKTSVGTISLAKKSLKEDDPIWTVKLDKKILREFEQQDLGPHFLSNSENKPVLVDHDGEVMAIVVEDFSGSACGESTYQAIFLVYITKNGIFKYLNIPTDGCTVVNETSVNGKKLEINLKEFAKPLVFESGELKTLAIPAPPVETVYKDSDAARKAFLCVKKARDDCPFFSEVYEGDLNFRNGLQVSFKEAGLSIPKWDMDGSMTPIVIEGESYIYGNAAIKLSLEPGRNSVEVLYSLQRKHSVGLYYVEDYDIGKWFGSPTEKEKKVLIDARDQSGKNPTGASISKGPFPIMVDGQASPTTGVVSPVESIKDVTVTSVTSSAQYIKNMLEGSLKDNEKMITDNKLIINGLSKPPKGDRKSARLANDDGLILFQSKQYEKAAPLFEKASQLDPSDVEVMNNYGYALLKSNQLDRAESVLINVLTIKPDRVSAWANYADTMALGGKEDLAVAAYLNAFRFTKDREKTALYFKKQLAEEVNSSIRSAITKALAKSEKLPGLQSAPNTSSP